MNLWTSYFVSENQLRQNEINFCLQKNIENNIIKTIYLICEEPIEQSHPKVKCILIKGRPTYNVFFHLINQYSEPEEWNIISNSDIYFDHTLIHLNKYSNACAIALTRWEVLQSGIKFLNRADSQDCWMLKGKLRKINGDFQLGKAGCDNAIANRLKMTGYQVINPSKTIKSYHVHNSNVRTYSVNERVAQPYLILNPTI